MGIVVALSIAFISFSLAWSDWFELLPGRFTGRVLGSLLLISMFIAFRYDPDAAMKPFIAVGDALADHLKAITNDLIPETTSTVPVPSSTLPTSQPVIP